VDKNEQQRDASRRLIVGLLGGAVVGGVIWIAAGVAGPRMGPGWQEVLQGLAFFVGLITAVVIVRVSQRRQRSVRGQG
jgi:hypothetical protein